MIPSITLSDENRFLLHTVAAAVLAVLVVVLSTYGRRCRHPVLRFIVWGASVGFIPLSSTVISALLEKRKIEKDTRCGVPLPGRVPCDDGKVPSGGENPDVRNMWTLLLWVVIILVIKGNADTAAASSAASSVKPSDDNVNVDGQKVRPPLELLFTYGWVAYLVVMCVPEAKWLKWWGIAIFIGLYVLGLAKMVLKLAVFLRAGGSYAVGKNARLVSGYMAQLMEEGEEDGHGQMPPYIVMGESKEHVEERPEGFRIKRESLDDKYSSLVTLDRVWRLSDHGDGLLAKRRELRDLCLSYSLFKSLRRRLSGYPLAEAGSERALDFVLRGMDTAAGAGNGDADRVFRVLVDELWFASDFYYSPLPLCSFSWWCAALNYLFSFLIVVEAVAVGFIYWYRSVVGTGNAKETAYLIITAFLLLVIVLTETWEIIAGLCSNWTKMALLGHYITGKSCCGQAALGAVLRSRPARRWSGKIGQNSVLEPGRFSRRLGFLSEKLYGRAGLMRSVKISQAVKDAVLRSLKSSHGGMNKGSTAARRVGLGGKVDWTCPSSGDSSNTDHILACHIGTRLFEMKTGTTSASADMTAACSLSNYCAYLVAAAPELLPDIPAWTQKRYSIVVADVQAALGKDDVDAAGKSTAQVYERLLLELSASCREKVLQRGAQYGRSLVEAYMEDEVAACRFLADFWSEMLLFVAPSNSVKGHVEAMGRGGEFVTLVWALLLHAGVTSRPDSSIP